MTHPATDTSTAAEPDPHQWLEEITGTAALDWVRARNAESAAELTDGGGFDELRESIREVLDSDARIPYVSRRGGYLYNFWRDAAHPRGLWRRTTLEQYRDPQPHWQILLDVDALAEREDESWVWEGATVRRPHDDRCLVELSRGGSDAAVVREFDLQTLEFVDDGFRLDEAKSALDWIDADHVYVGTDFGADALTSSGYPRIVKLWRRGTALADATTVYEGTVDDVLVQGSHDATPGYERDFVLRAVDFYNSELFLRTADGLRQLDVPSDADVSVHHQWLLVRTRSPWQPGQQYHPAGALLAAPLDEFTAGNTAMTTLFSPDAHTALHDYAWTRDHLLVATLADVTTQLRVLTPRHGQWHSEPLPGLADVGSVDIVDTDPYTGNDFFLNASSFTTPATLLHGTVGDKLEALKHAPEFFDADGITTGQYFATSADGTRIPYFVIGSATHEARPTLLSAYGGFEISLTPSYSGVIGRGWLRHGATYVVANLRGGGEYGPEWHERATGSNRHLVYEDCAAVAADLVARGITTAGQLGIEGGSNGGLLTGVMLTSYPQLFGAVVSQVPLLDMARYHKLLAGASWMAEYGDPDLPRDWAYLRSHSPYHNVEKATQYPPSLLVTSTKDDRVHPGHARKMVARLAECGQDVRYYENIEGGHGAAANNEQLAYKRALVFRFLYEHLFR